MAEAKEITVEEKLKKLYDLQKVMSQIDNLRAVRGELPLEVKDLGPSAHITAWYRATRRYRRLGQMSRQHISVVPTSFPTL